MTTTTAPAWGYKVDDTILLPRERQRREDPAMGVLGYERIEADFYPTEKFCTDALLRNYEFPNAMVWEPACGDGAISRVLVESAAFPTFFSSDLHDRGYGLPGQDFLKIEKPPKSDIRSIITNPPYSLAEEFIRHAIDLMKPVGGTVAMLLRNEYDCAAGRVDLFLHPAFAMKLVLTKRPRWIVGSTGSPRHPYAWYCWNWRHQGPPTIRWDK